MAKGAEASAEKIAAGDGRRGFLLAPWRPSRPVRGLLGLADVERSRGVPIEFTAVRSRPQQFGTLANGVLRLAEALAEE